MGKIEKLIIALTQKHTMGIQQLEILLINEFSDEPYSSTLLDRKMITLREERLLGRHQREEVDVGVLYPHHRENSPCTCVSNQSYG